MFKQWFHVQRGQQLLTQAAALLVTLLFSALPTLVAAEYTLIANKSVATNSLSKSDTRSIFLGDKTLWKDGTVITFVILESSPTHESFLKDIVRKTPSQFNRYWKKMLFTGKASTPKSFDDINSLTKYISNNHGAVGYVPGGITDSSVKIIMVK